MSRGPWRLLQPVETRGGRARRTDEQRVQSRRLLTGKAAGGRSENAPMHPRAKMAGETVERTERRKVDHLFTQRFDRAIDEIRRIAHGSGRVEDDGGDLRFRGGIEGLGPQPGSDGLVIPVKRLRASRAGLEIIETYRDVAMSGRREGRPQLNALMTAARNHEIDCVPVWKFDRLARSTRHLLTALEAFNHLGVRFVSVQDQVDTDSPMGRAMFTIIGAMAELESSLISERVTAGMNAARVRGERIGRPPLAPPVVGRIEALAATTGPAYVRFKRKSRGASVEESSGRSRSASGPASRMPCDLLLHVCSTNPWQPRHMRAEIGEQAGNAAGLHPARQPECPLTGTRSDGTDTFIAAKAFPPSTHRAAMAGSVVPGHDEEAFRPTLAPRVSRPRGHYPALRG